MLDPSIGPLCYSLRKLRERARKIARLAISISFSLFFSRKLSKTLESRILMIFARSESH